MKVHGHDGNWQRSRRLSKATMDEYEPQTFGLTGGITNRPITKLYPLEVGD
ncbi:hypothetical protein DPMN_171135 [Dreissena polymorpha]|uniref:Uncharacterized protein n=1 Tax=Dreissena polymorpha TaxID=45954 RepID=A0A9D4DXJ4_DREPO|nr:hypothetical protein DPMN_171135 [Dreissena polymorpha]